MEEIFVDTSALFALISMNDENYDSALNTLDDLLQHDTLLITNNYVIVECFSLLQRRLGIEAVRELEAKIIPLIQIEWIDEEQHTAIVRNVFSANRRQLSLVDCSGFESMQRLNLEKIFTFDSHFTEQGFTVIP